MAWYDKNSESQTHEVGKGKQPNEWGFYDMHGNVLEWTSTAVGWDRVIRGGSWFTSAGQCESSNWSRFLLDVRNSSFGFRLYASAGTD
jgi:formylglycine-generating enzyme required for sulfatase activity